MVTWVQGVTCNGLDGLVCVGWCSEGGADTLHILTVFPAMPTSTKRQEA